MVQMLESPWAQLGVAFVGAVIFTGSALIYFQFIEPKLKKRKR